MRIQIESDNIIYLQKPNSLQISELALTQFNITSPSKSTSYVYYDFNHNGGYIAGFDNLVITNNKIDPSTTLKIKPMIGDDLDAHEVIIHPADGILEQKNQEINFLNKSKNVENNGIVYFKDRVIETIDQNGNKVYIVPGIPKVEANTVEMEGIVRNNAVSNPENRRVYYDINDVINNSKVFRTQREVNDFFR